jgi:hypothetical protein
MSMQDPRRRDAPERWDHSERMHGGTPVRSPWRRSEQCSLTLARLAAWRGRGDRGAQGEAIGEVEQGAV